jgi:hypothetical protein
MGYSEVVICKQTERHSEANRQFLKKKVSSEIGKSQEENRTRITINDS